MLTFIIVFGSIFVGACLGIAAMGWIIGKAIEETLRRRF